jgi:hypothetical protein
MNQRLTRQEALALGHNKCYGSICSKHPELEGLRRVSGACIQCARDTLNRSRKNNPEKVKENKLRQYKKQRQDPAFVAKKRELDRQYQKNNSHAMYAKTREWLALHPGKTKAYATKHRQNHPGVKNADTAKRRAAKLQRTPKWLTQDDLWIIQEAYKLAAIRTKMFGFAWHVDHIIPLQGDTVSGLHVPTNVQVIPWIDNIQKSNKLDVGVN